MAKKIIGILILAILIGFGAYYGTRALGVNPIENNLATIIVPDIDPIAGYYGILVYHEMTGKQKPCFTEQQKVDGIKTQIKQVTKAITDLTNTAPQTDVIKQRIKNNQRLLSSLDDDLKKAEKALADCLKKQGKK